MYIKLAPNGAGPSAGCCQRWAPALALRPRQGHGPVGRGPGRGLWPRPALRFIVKLTYLRCAYASVYRYSLEVFPVSSLE